MDSHIVGFAAVFGAMFAIANPFSGIAFFLGYTSSLSTWRQKLLAALLTAGTVWVAAVIVLYLGNAVLTFFGVSVPGLRVGGGFVILLSGLAMMKTNVDDTSKSGRSLWCVVHDLVRHGHEPHAAAAAVHASSPDAAASLHAGSKKADASPAGAAITHVTSGAARPSATAATLAANTKAAYLSLMFPFAIPMILGSGFMSTIIISASDNDSLTVLIALSANVIITFVVFALGTPIRAILGTFGMNVLLRLVGLIVIVLAFEIMAAGLVDLPASESPGRAVAEPWVNTDRPLPRGIARTFVTSPRRSSRGAFLHTCRLLRAVRLRSRTRIPSFTTDGCSATTARSMTLRYSSAT